MTRVDYENMINEFEAHYQYDCTYMRELLSSSIDAFTKFANFLPLARHIEFLTVDEAWLAKLAAVQAEDCGECLQLNVRMAVEAGVDKEIIKAAIKGGDKLRPELRDVFQFAQAIAEGRAIDDTLLQRIRSNYDKAALLEFGLNIASVRVFPVIKRALGYAKSCALIELEI